VVNPYGALDRGKGQISDPILQIMDLHVLFKGLHIPLRQSSMAIVLIHMGSAVLAKSKILAVTTVVHALQGQKNLGEHGANLIPPKEMIVEGTPGLTPILLGSKLLDVLPCTREAKTCKEDGPNLLGVGQSRRWKQMVHGP
jgi:hypothetical protein